MAAINAEIRFQFRQGAGNLPQRAQYLFDGNLDDLLQTSIRHQKQWLASVSAACAMAVNHQSQQDQEMGGSITTITAGMVQWAYHRVGLELDHPRGGDGNCTHYLLT